MLLYHRPPLSEAAQIISSKQCGLLNALLQSAWAPGGVVTIHKKMDERVTQMRCLEMVQAYFSGSLQCYVTR